MNESSNIKATAKELCNIMHDAPDLRGLFFYKYFTLVFILRILADFVNFMKALKAALSQGKP